MTTMPPEQAVVRDLITPAVREAIDGAFAILPPAMDNIRARVLVYAFGLQESKFKSRRQIVNAGRDSQGKPLFKAGPAAGWWQFELGGGVTGVLLHEASSKHAARVCELRNVDPEPYEVWKALQHDDVLAACFARLLIWTDPLPLPEMTDVEGAWALYKNRLWRPSAYHKSTFPTYHAAARLAVERRRDSSRL